MTILVLPLALHLLVLAVLMAKNAGPLSCGLCHVLLCETRVAPWERLPLTASHAFLYTSSADGFSGSLYHMFFQLLLMCVQPPHTVPMKYVLFISSAVEL